MFQDVVARYGTVDILVANAGLQRDAAFVKMSLADWQFVLNVNLTGQFLCAREAAREFLRRGMVPSRSSALGKIICMSSVHQVIPWGGHLQLRYVQRRRDAFHEEHRPGTRSTQNSCQCHSALKLIRTAINRSAWETTRGGGFLTHLDSVRSRGRVPEDIARAVCLVGFGRLGLTLQEQRSSSTAGWTLYPGFATGG